MHVASTFELLRESLAALGDSEEGQGCRVLRTCKLDLPALHTTRVLTRGPLASATHDQSQTHDADAPQIKFGSRDMVSLHRPML